jgi:hypothetical protein
MPVTETVLIYGVVPLAVFLVLAALTLLPGRGKDRTKYKPGQPWTAEPLWFEPHPGVTGGHGDAHGDAHGDVHGDGHRGPGLGATAAALTIGEHPHGVATVDGPRRTAAGGARGTW